MHHGGIIGGSDVSSRLGQPGCQGNIIALTRNNNTNNNNNIIITKNEIIKKCRASMRRDVLTSLYVCCNKCGCNTCVKLNNTKIVSQQSHLSPN